jgi:hypothetical protein
MQGKGFGVVPPAERGVREAKTGPNFFFEIGFDTEGLSGNFLPFSAREAESTT